MINIRPRRISEYLEILWRRKMLFVLMTGAVLISTLYIVRRVPNLYESKASVVVTAPITDERLVQAVPFNLLLQQLRSRSNLEHLLERYNLYPDIKDQSLAIKKLDKAITIDPKMRAFPETPDSVTISFRHHDPVSAQKVVSELIAPFEDANTQSSLMALEEQRQLDARISKVEDELKAMGPQRGSQSIRDALDRAREEYVSNKNQRMAIETNIETLNERQFSLQRQISEINKQIAEQEVAVRTSATAQHILNNPEYQALHVKKIDLESQIKEHSPTHTERHPKMVSLRLQVADINRKIDAIEKGTRAGNVPQSISPEYSELRALQREKSRLSIDLEVVNHEIGQKNRNLVRLPNVNPTRISAPPESIIGTDYDRLINFKNWLLDRKDDLMKRSTGRSPDSPLFRVVNKPNLPESPEAPNRLLLLLVAAGISFFFGAAIVMAFEFPRLFSINDDRDIEYYLGAPILALIPESTTPIERARQQRLRWSRGLALLLFAAALVPAVILLLNRLQFFQFLGSK
jgi:uncharacterized protein involved in exopolysaccharide biosynthesis